MINICGSVCIPGAKHGMLELIPQTLFFLERASANMEEGSGYQRLKPPMVGVDFKTYVTVCKLWQVFANEISTANFSFCSSIAVQLLKYYCEHTKSTQIKQVCI